MDADERSARCADRLASFKVPSEFAFIEELARTSVGKVQKHPLKDRARPSDCALG